MALSRNPNSPEVSTNRLAIHLRAYRTTKTATAQRAPAFLGTGQAIQQIRETVEGTPHILQVSGASHIGALVFLEYFLASLRGFVRTLWRRVTPRFQDLVY